MEDKCCWFRIFTTFVGITVTDAFLVSKYHDAGGANINKMSIKEFAEYIVHDLWNVNWNNKGIMIDKMSDSDRSV